MSAPAPRRVTKVSYDGKRVKVHFEIPRVGSEEPDEFTFVCNDPPLPGLPLALEALRLHVQAICQLPQGYCAMMAIRGASYGYGGADAVMGATIAALKRLTTARSPLILNTPYLASAPMSETDEAPTLSPAARQDLNQLAAEALRYVDGEREQGDLFPSRTEKVVAAVGEALANLAPERGGGIDTVTLRSGGQEVTLRQGDGERIRRNMGVVRGDKGKTP